MDWKTEYLIGIHEIDEQHKMLIECISGIEKSVARYDRRSADAAVVRLADLSAAHFTLEECLMRILDYPGLEEHADDHKQFSVHMKLLMEPLLTTDVYRQRIRYLHGWWDTHVLKHDKSCGLHFLTFTALGRA